MISQDARKPVGKKLELILDEAKCKANAYIKWASTTI